MPPEFKQSNRSFVKEKILPVGMTIHDLGDSSLRSFMGQGDARFDINGIVEKGVNGAPNVTRRTVIDGVRTNILERMKEINLDAAAEASKMRLEHEKSFGRMNKLFKEREAATREKNKLELEKKYLEGDKKGFIDAISALNASLSTKYTLPAPTAAPVPKVQVQYAQPAAPKVVAPVPVRPAASAPVAAAAVDYLSLTDDNVKRALATVLQGKDEAWRNANLPGYKDAKDAYTVTFSDTSSHYVTVIGISEDGRIKYLDSSGYDGVAEKKTIEEFLTHAISVEIEWISDNIDPSMLLNRNSDVALMNSEIDSIPLMRGDVFTGSLGNGMSEAMYIPNPDAERDGALLEEAIHYMEPPKEEGKEKDTVKLPSSVKIAEKARSAALSQGGTATTAIQSVVSEDGFIQPAILDGMEKAYEMQPPKSNNCYAVTEAALLNHYLARKESRTVTREFGQEQVRNYRPLVRRGMLLPTGRSENIDASTVGGTLTEIDKYAGPGKKTIGNIFSLGDFIMDEILAHDYIASLNKSVYDMNFEELVRNQVVFKFSKKIESIMREGAVAGVLTHKRSVKGELSREENIVAIDRNIAKYFCYITDVKHVNASNPIDKLRRIPTSLQQVMPDDQWAVLAVEVAGVLNPQAVGEEEVEEILAVPEDSEDQGSSTTSSGSFPVSPSPLSVLNSPSPEPERPSPEVSSPSPEPPSTSDVTSSSSPEASSTSEGTSGPSPESGKDVEEVAKDVEAEAKELTDAVKSAISSASASAAVSSGSSKSEAAASAPTNWSDIEAALQPAIASLGSTENEFRKDLSVYSGIFNDISANKIPHVVGWHKFWNRLYYDKQVDKEKKLGDKIENECSIWRVEYELYKRDVIKKLDDAYDQLAQSWYELTHEFALRELGPNPTQAQIDQYKQNRSIKGESIKDISEYAGVYDLGRLKSQLNYALKNPYYNLEFDPLVAKATTGYADSVRGDVPKPTITHKRFSMYGREQDSKGPTRYVFDENFEGRRFEIIPRLQQKKGSTDTEESKKSEESEESKTDVAKQPAIITLQPLQYAESLRLDLDEKGANGAFIHSEKSARLYRAQRRRDKQTLWGFYSSGQLVMNESVPDGTRFSTYADMKGLSDKTYKGMEEIRAAIRRSPFFNHVNAATIQLYAEYQAVSDFGNALNKELETAYGQEDRSSTRNTNKDILKQQDLDDAIDDISPGQLGDALAAYIEDQYQQNGAGSESQIISDPVFTGMLDRNKDAVVKAVTILLLEDDKPGLWDVAKYILANNRDLIDFRSRVMLDNLTMSGELMRTALLNELANHQGLFSELHPEKDEDITSFIQILPQITVWREELMNRRDLDSRALQHIVNGEVFRKVFGVVSAATVAGFQFNDAAELAEAQLKGVGVNPTMDAEKKRQDSRSNVLWAAYGNTVASGTRVLALVEGLVGGVGLGFNMASGDWSSDSTGSQIRNYGAFGLEDLATFITGTVKCTRAIASAVKKSRETGQINASPDLESKTPWADFWKEVLGYGTTLVDMAQAMRDFASNFGLAASELGGYVDRALKIVTEIIDFINHCLDIHIGRKREEGLSEADSRIESAISIAIAEAEKRGKNASAAKMRSISVNQMERQAKRLDESDPQRLSEQVGLAAMENSQVQFYLSLSRDATKKQLMRNTYALGRDVVAATRDTLAIGAKATKDLGTMVATGIFTLAPYVIDFARWCHGKLGYDIPNFKKNVAAMLGNASYASEPYFNDVLERETGIVNSDYLVDLARIFTSIDTHVLATNPKTVGEYELARTMVSSFYNNVTAETMRKLKLSDLLKFSGFNEGSDWRAVLRHSLTG